MAQPPARPRRQVQALLLEQLDAHVAPEFGTPSGAAASA
jgi:hypothetical protein